jgi:hypothetical protein
MRALLILGWFVALGVVGATSGCTRTDVDAVTLEPAAPAAPAAQIRHRLLALRPHYRQVIPA